MNAALRRGAGFVHIYGHRGARGVFAENTMPGFRHVLDLGLTGIEFDVLTSADGTAVLTHNPTLLPETTRDADGAWLTGDGPQVSLLDDAALARFDVGAIRTGTPYHARFAEQARLSGIGIPSLDALCRLALDQPDLWLNLEIKRFPETPDLTASAQALARAALAPIQAHGLAPRTLVQSFDWAVIHAMRDQAPDIARAYLSYLDDPPGRSLPNVFPGSVWMDGCALTDHGGSLPRAIADLGGQGWSPYVDDVTEAEVAEAHELGLVVNVWTVNSVADMQRMIAIGVDGIITDFPARAQNVLAEAGLGWRPRADA